MDFNQCSFIGNLGRDPETRYSPSGDAICNFTLAVTEKWKTKDGEAKERTEWVRVVAYKKLAEICDKYLAKGKAVFVQGRMQTREWQDKEGVKRYTTEIVADTLKMLGGSPGGGSRGEAREQSRQAPQGRGSTASGGSFEDEIPF